jgi:hypothetical protein
MSINGNVTRSNLAVIHDVDTLKQIKIKTSKLNLNYLTKFCSDIYFASDNDYTIMTYFISIVQ